jgi:hypothetical protein
MELNGFEIGRAFLPDEAGEAHLFHRIGGIFGGDPTVDFAAQLKATGFLMKQKVPARLSFSHNLCVTVEYQPDQKKTRGYILGRIAAVDFR